MVNNAYLCHGRGGSLFTVTEPGRQRGRVNRGSKADREGRGLRQAKSLTRMISGGKLVDRMKDWFKEIF